LSASSQLGETHVQQRPCRVVALGGGTGMPSVLRGLRRHVAPGGISSLTGIVTMTDDGGSSGRLRRTRGLPPPGDIRNCLVALSPEEDLLAGLFQHRYNGSEEIGGHTVGNLILVALAEQTGSFLKAIEVSSRVLRVVGTILPATSDDVVLEAILEDGTAITGETAIAACERHIRRIGLRPGGAKATSGVVDAILSADLVILGPGSLFTSLVPNLVIDEIGAALRQTAGQVILVANLVSERGEAAGLDLADHVRVLDEHTGGPFLDGVLVHDGALDAAILARYREEGAVPLRWPNAPESGVRILRKNLIAGGPKLRHDSEATCQGLFELWSECSANSVSMASRIARRS
jgi:uncharacterized cofD-like protein